MKKRITIFLVSSIMLAGCGSDLPKTSSVNGKVTYDGQLVTQGTVTFYPKSGRSALGRIQSDGSYSLTTFAKEDGALLGQHVVTIEALRFTNVDKQPASLEEELEMARSGNSPRVAKAEWLVPKRYSQRNTSELTAEVKPSGAEINFDLPTK